MFWRQLLDLLLGILKTQIYLNRDFRLDSVFKFFSTLSQYSQLSILVWLKLINPRKKLNLFIEV
jgi:hypothetical protein